MCCGGVEYWRWLEDGLEGVTAGGGLLGVWKSDGLYLSSSGGVIIILGIYKN